MHPYGTFTSSIHGQGHGAYPISYDGSGEGYHDSEAMAALTDQQHGSYGYPVPSNLMLSMPSMSSGIIASPLYENIAMSPMFSPQSDVYAFSVSGSSTPHPHHQEQLMYQWPIISGPPPYVTAQLPHYPRGSVMVQTVPTSEILYGPGPPIVTGDTIRGPDGCNLFVFHLPNEMTNWDLYNLFKRFGTILSVHIMINKQTGLSRGFGFVSFQVKADADQAIRSMNGFRIGNKRLKVQTKRRGQKFDSAEMSDDPASGVGSDRREAEQATTTNDDRELKISQPSTVKPRPESVPQAQALPGRTESSDTHDLDSITPTTQTTATTFESSPGSAKVAPYED